MGSDEALERITGDRDADGPQWNLHVCRYRFAGGFTDDDDTVVDAACGTGYGSEYLRGAYVGVDQVRSDRPLRPGARRVVADLHRWEPDFDYDVWIGLETIEHLPVIDHYIEMAKRAKRWIIVSTPIIPTTHFNHYHVRDFTEPEVVDLFADEHWTLFDVLHQQAAIYGLFAFERRL